MTNLTRILLLGWLLQPLYVLSELVIATGSREPYSFLDDTISALGITSCRTEPFPESCSAHHAWMNASFIVFGVLLAAGAVAFWRTLPRSRTSNAASAMWFASGLCSIGVGLAPLDYSQAVHYAVALPIFVIRPIALALSARLLTPHFPRLGNWTWAVAALTLVGAVGFALAGTGGALRGATERLALWPADIWFAVVAVALLRHRWPVR